MNKVITEITRDKFKTAHHLRAACTAGCPGEVKEVWDDNVELAVCGLEGYFKTHVLQTGHRIVIEEVGA